MNWKRKAVGIMEPTIGAMWQGYRAEVLDPSGIVSAIQLQETRRTFYAAAGCMLQLVAQLSEHLSEDDAAQALSDMSAEAYEFMAKVMREEEGY